MPKLKLLRTGKAYLHSERNPIEILPEKRHITWVLAVVLLSAEFQMEPLVTNVTFYYTSQDAELD